MNIQSVFEYSDGYVLLLLDNGESEVVDRDDLIVQIWKEKGGKIEPACPVLTEVSQR